MFNVTHEVYVSIEHRKRKRTQSAKISQQRVDWPIQTFASHDKKVWWSERAFVSQGNGFQCNKFPNTSWFNQYAESVGWREIYLCMSEKLVQLRPVASKLATEIA